MATHRLSILGGAIPDATGRAFYEPYSVKATNDLFKHMVLILNDPTSNIHGVYGAFSVPKNYVDTASIIVVFTSTVNTGTAALAFDYDSTADGETLDEGGSFDEETNGNAVAPATAQFRKELAISLTDSNIVADDTLHFFFTRDGVFGTPNDTMAAALTVVDLLFQYNDA